MSQTKSMNRNPDGKGGFSEHPENRADGRWSKENSYSYWLNYFKNLTEKEFLAYKKKRKGMSMAAVAAYERVFQATEKLEEFREVANRTEGMPKQSLQLGADETLQRVQIEVVRPKKEDADGNT